MAHALTAYGSDIGLALEHVYSLRTTYSIAAVNMSLGGDWFTEPCDAVSPALTTIINNLRDANIATVIASGNGSQTNAISYPACISSAISVGATTKQNGIAGFSNSASFLSLLAPGVSVISSVPGGGYGGASGTSMATPHVAGAWAVIKSAAPIASIDEVLDSLQATGIPITDPRNGITKSLIQIGDTTGGAIAALLDGAADGGADGADGWDECPGPRDPPAQCHGHGRGRQHRPGGVFPGHHPAR